jgi:hypothetical protein
MNTMRKRLIGRVVTAVVAVVLALLALQSAHKVDPEQLHEGSRSIAYALLCLAAVTAYRNLED